MPGQSLAAVTDTQILESEAEFGLTLPRSFVQVLQVQNGGPIRGSYGLDMLPLESSRRRDRIRPVSELAARGEYIDEDALESISEEIGDPRWLLAFAFDGSYCYVLNYNANGPHGEPTVDTLDLGGNFMFGGSQQVARTFQELVDKIQGSSE